MRLEKRSAVVTGAATGIGRAIAIAMAAEGASVAIDYVGNPEWAKSGVVAEIAKSGGTAIAVAADVSKSSEANALVAAAVKAFGGLDVFVNNAGIEYRYDFLDTPDDSWEQTLAVDLSGPFYCSRAAGKQMVAQGRGGRIINISSIHEDVVFQQHAPYCAAKGGVRMLMRTIVVELAEVQDHLQQHRARRDLHPDRQGRASESQTRGRAAGGDPARALGSARGDRRRRGVPCLR